MVSRTVAATGRRVRISFSDAIFSPQWRMEKTIAAWSFLFWIFCDLGEDDLQRAFFFILAQWAFFRI
ncbi:hypothetical protein HanPSC8_Chr16g0745781 [Helianthus annuus]|nr:hypothetical protein HanPSC8_Chr16g0745781 [Helianthus annuus]